ncbi:MAG: hypothetical protein WAK93_11005 [Solirubrobacteraceae bacterium]
MKLRTRKSKLQQILDAVTDSVDGTSFRRGVSSIGSKSAVTSMLTEGAVRKAGLVAGGLAGLTVGSVGISSYRHRTEGARGDS